MHDPLFFLHRESFGTYSRVIAKELKSLAGAVLIGEMIERRHYYAEKDQLISDKKHGDGWIYLTCDDVEDRTSLSREEQDSALRKLKAAGLIEQQNFGLPLRRHFKINDDKVLELYGLRQNSKIHSKLRDSHKLGCVKDTNCPVGFTQPSHIGKENLLREKLNKKPAVAGLFDASAIELVDFFLKKLLEMKPNLRKPDKSSWVKHFEAMLRLDKRSMESIKRVIEFVVSDPFESKNVLSPDKLRKRFDQLELKSNVKPSGNEISPKDKSISILCKYLVPNDLSIQVLNSCIEFQRRDHPNADIVSFDNKSWENDLLHMINKWGLKKAKLE